MGGIISDRTLSTRYDSLASRFWSAVLSAGALSKCIYVSAILCLYFYLLEPNFSPGLIARDLLQSDNTRLIKYAVSIALLFAAGVAVRGWELRLVQSHRDRKATEILVATLNGKVNRFFLYVRPFFLTRRMTIENPVYHSRQRKLLRLLSYRDYQPNRIDLETQIETSLRDEGLLIALGHPGENIGAGRIAASDLEWQTWFKSLAPNAELILVVPSHTDGTKWEIEWLKENNHLQKTIFLMPPKLSASQVDVAVFWNQTGSILGQEGFQLPAYLESGLLFKLDSKGTISRQVTLGNLRDLRTAVRQIRT